MKNMNVTNCTSYSNGINSPLEYLNITTPAEFKVVMDLLCNYDEEKKSASISRTGIARDTAMSVSNVERALKTLAQKDIIRTRRRNAKTVHTTEHTHAGCTKLTARNTVLRIILPTMWCISLC